MSTTAGSEAPSLERARGALLGLALGDAYGRTPEFVLLPAARPPPAATPRGVRSGSEGAGSAGGAEENLPSRFSAQGSCSCRFVA